MRHGSGITVVIPATVLSPTGVLVGSDAENFYVMDKTKAATATRNFRKVASTGGPALPVACDVGEVQNRLINGVLPATLEHEVVFGATEMFWIEKRGTNTAKRWFVRRSPK